MNDFEKWDIFFRNNKFNEFNNSENGIIWLKTKSIIRKELLDKFLTNNFINLQSLKINERFRELYNYFLNNQSEIEKLNEFIKNEFKTLNKKIDKKELVSELYKLQNFNWGGDYQNSLDKYLIRRYIKIDNPSFDILQNKFETEINDVVKGYVLNSWYNYWSSVLIENIFKSHNNVLPTIGQIKSVDFFINNIPFDLKVTYLPAEFIRTKRKEKNWLPELTYLKQKAKVLNIDFNINSKPNQIYYEIIEKLKDKNTEDCKETIFTLKHQNIEILKDAKNNPKDLIKWLYENQGEMRFGAENRIYLILFDIEDVSNSWKLKRNLELLKPTVNKYLNEFESKKIDNLKINFEFKKNHYEAISDIIFVTKQ
jgi:hypothetical protein